MTRCVNCRQLVPNYEIVNLGSLEGGYRVLCRQCSNAEAAAFFGLAKFQDHKFEPVAIADCDGLSHKFHFRTHLFHPDGVSIDALEIRDGYPSGYEFQIIGDPAEDLLVLLGRLLEKIRRALSVKHLEEGNLGLRIAEKVVRGRIEWDADRDGHAPLVVIDGREITWEHFGHMMMTFEGWQFKLEIRGKSEET